LGLGGNDWLRGGRGDDALDGGDGNDRLGDVARVRAEDVTVGCESVTIVQA
jgi:hypothetical protein